MVFVWGSGLYGKVDAVPGMCHVATKFHHLYYIPLIPAGCWIVTSKEGNGWTGKPISMSGKSIFIAWLRAASIVAMIVGIFGGLIGYHEGAGAGTEILYGSIGIGIAGLLFLVGSYYLPGVGKASHERARQLAEELGIDERGLVMIDVLYGTVDSSEAEWKIKKLDEQAGTA